MNGVSLLQAVCRKSCSVGKRLVKILFFAIVIVFAMLSLLQIGFILILWLYSGNST
ncbi:hypothetical protein [Paenibacillus ihumii]|uniref:hypothetical protein n=1 Tax=Paenibacillus ihumii TaxID=687436 RepID=UPI000A5AD6A9|nr:hypothetical protein [Paenibacillus ihumii]